MLDGEIERVGVVFLDVLGDKLLGNMVVYLLVKVELVHSGRSLSVDIEDCLNLLLCRGGLAVVERYWYCLVPRVFQVLRGSLSV